MKKSDKGLLSWARNLASSKVLRGSFLISSAAVLGGAVNFAFNIFMSRLLGSEQYGIVYPLISLFMIFSLPALALQYVLTREYSGRVHHAEWSGLRVYHSQILRWILVLLTAFILILMLIIPFLKSYFHISDSNAFYLLYLCIPFTLIAIPYVSLVQSRERFLVYSVYTLLSVLIKFIAGVGIVSVTHDYSAVLLGLFISQALSFAIIYIDSKRFKKLTPVHHSAAFGKRSGAGMIKKAIPLKKFARSFVYALLSVGSFQLITYLDSVLVRHYLPDSSGVYSVVNLVGKASFFIALAVSFVMFPLMAKDKKNLRSANFRAFMFLLGILLLYAFFIWFISGFLSAVVFAGKYPGMENILPLYGFMFVPFAVVSYFVNYYVIAEKLFYSFIILAGAALQWTGITVFHRDLTQVSLVVGASGILIMGVLLADMVLFGKNHMKRTESNVL